VLRLNCHKFMSKWRRKRCPAALCTAVALLGAAAVAQWRAPSAVEIIRRTIAAHGGETFRRPQTLELCGRAVYYPRDGGPAIEIERLRIARVIPQESQRARRPNGKVLVEAWSGGHLFFREGFDGERAWSQLSVAARPIADYLRLDRHFGFGIIRFADAPGFRLDRLPDGEVEGRPAYRVAITDVEGRTTHFAIDRMTHLIHKVEFDTPLGHHERIYWSYDARDRVKEARHVRLIFAGHKLFDVWWEEVRYNRPLPDALFAPPDR